MRYPIVIHKDPDSDYGVTVPDLSGCFSAGDTVDDALTQAVQAIECHIEGLLLDKQPIPMPKSIEHHQNTPDYAEGTWAIVSVDLQALWKVQTGQHYHSRKAVDAGGSVHISTWGDTIRTNSTSRDGVYCCPQYDWGAHIKTKSFSQRQDYFSLGYCYDTRNTRIAGRREAMQKKLTITIDEQVYEGLYCVIGPRHISRFIEDLVRPHILHSDLAAYQQMAQDEERESLALEWSEATIGDVSHKA